MIQQLFNKEIKRIFDYILTKTRELDPHLNNVTGCTCSDCKEHEEICKLIDKWCEN